MPRRRAQLLPPRRSRERESSSCISTECKATSFWPGTVVVAMGLTGAPELNGRKGFVLGWDEAKQRYTVQLGGRTKLVALKPDNCLAEMMNPDSMMNPDTMMNVLKQSFPKEFAQLFAK